MNKKLLIIAGMHRSGTSATAGMLEELGVALGENLAPGHEGINDKGYKEDMSVVTLHEDLLWSIPSAWFDPRPIDLAGLQESARLKAVAAISTVLEGYFSKADVCAVKDPRVCSFIPLWIEACDALSVSLHFVVPFRNPDSVAQSLRKRDGFSDTFSRYLWLSYMLEAEKQTRGFDRLFVSYEHLVEKPTYNADRFVNWINHPRISFSGTVDFISADLNRSKVEEKVEAQVPLADMLFDILQELEACSELDVVAEKLDRIYQQFLAELDGNWTLISDLEYAYRVQAGRYQRYRRELEQSRLVRWAGKLKRLLAH